MKKLLLISFFILTASAAFLLFNIPVAHAVTDTWIGGTTGNWTDASKWDNGVPDATMDVVISTSTSAIVVTVPAGTINFSTLQISGGSAAVSVTLTGSIGTGGSITIKNLGTLTQNNASAQTITGTLLIESGGTLTHSANGTTAQGLMYDVNFSAATITINSGGSINADNKGYGKPPANTSGYGPGGGTSPGPSSGYAGGGGANGGSGGANGQTGSNEGKGGTGYCSLSDPASSGMGSSGGSSWQAQTGNAGGGLIILNVSGTLTVNGTISAKSTAVGAGGGGAGGSVKIVADIIAGTPQSFSVAGGSSTDVSAAGSGGGGCGLIQYTTSNSILPTGAYFSMSGGTAGVTKGGAGQVLVKQAAANGDLYVINTSSGATSTPQTANYTFDNVTFNSYALFDIPVGKTLTVADEASISGDGTSGVRLYGTLNFSSGTLGTISGYSLYVYLGGTVYNSATIDVPSTSGLYLYSGSVLNNTSLTTLSATGTLYLAGGISSVATLNSAGTTSLYRGFTSSLTNFNINSGTASLYNYTTTTPALSLTNLVINSGGTLSHGANGTTAQGQMHILNISATTVTVNSGGSINVDDKGYAGPTSNYTNGYGPGGGTQPGNGWPGGAGANGGNGAVDSHGLSGGYGYCNVSDPALSGFGSSGSRGNGNTTNSGGGLVILNVTGTLTVNGTISAKSTAVGNGSGGAGGSVKIVAGTIAGTPQSFSIAGGSSTDGSVGGGGGGCGLITYTTSNTIVPAYSYFAMGGGGSTYIGGAGQFLVKQASANGDLYALNSGSGTSTPFSYNYTVDTLTIATSTIADILPGKTLTIANGDSIFGDNTGTGQIRDYGTLTFLSGSLSSINNFKLYVYSGGGLTNSSAMNVGSTGSLYLYQGALLNTSSLTVLSSTGTLYMESGVSSAITTLNSAGTTNLYRGFTSSLTNFNINSGTASLYNYTTTTPALSLTNLVINSGGTLSHGANGTTAQGQMHILNISATTVTVNPGGSINVDDKGYAGPTSNYTNGYGPGGGTQPGNGYPGGGGANGGNGGIDTHGGTGGVAYCNVSDPALSGFGSSGSSGNGSRGNAGGGLTILSVSGTLTVNGTISAKSSVIGSGGAGAGGSMKIFGNIVVGTPQSFTAAGGSSNGGDGGGGGGGCVNLSYQTSNTITSGMISVAAGGTGARLGSVGQTSVVQTNQAPVATAISPAQSDANTVTFNTAVSDADLNVTSLTVEYSTDNVSWSAATLGTVTPSSGSVSVAGGVISSIDTDTGSVTLTIPWNVNTDLPNTEDTTVYLRVTPNDGTVNGTTQTSSAFALDTKAPIAPGAPTASSAAITSLTLAFGSQSTDQNNVEYKIFYDTSSATISSPSMTSTTDANLGSTNYGGALTTTVSSLTANTNYYFLIVAYDPFGRSTQSAFQLQYATLASTPSSVAGAADNTTQITLSWSGNATGYYAENVTSATNSGWIGTTSYAFSGLTCGTSYDFQVKGRNVSNIETASSTIASASTGACATVSSGASSNISPSNVPAVSSPSTAISISPTIVTGGTAGPLATGARKSARLSFNVSNVAYMAISSRPDFRDVAWLPYSSTFDWPLTANSGTQNLYIKFSSFNGGETPVYSQVINIDALNAATPTPPTTPPVVPPTPPVTPTTPPTTPAVPAIPAKPPVTSVTPGFEFKKFLSIGSSGNDVRELQKALKDLGFYAYPSITGYFGSGTVEAVKKFQVRHNLDPFGYVGPGTRAVLNQLISEQAPLVPGDLIKASDPAVYYLGSDGKRYVFLFPNEKTFFTWYADFSDVKTITDAELASFPIGGNVTYKPGTKMVKIITDPKVYAVDLHSKLRWITSEAVAIALYGVDWAKSVEDVPDSFFVNYTMGANINSAVDFNPTAVSAAALSINFDKGLGQ